MPDGELILAIDSGGTKSDVLLLDVSGKIIAGGSVPGIAALHENTLPVETILRHGMEQFGDLQKQISLVFCSLGGPNTEEVTAVLKKILPFARIFVERESNGKMLLHKAEEYSARAICLCGTGSVAFGTVNGTFRLAGGWGPVYGDEGSGGGLGMAALKMILAAIDRREGDSILPGVFPALERPGKESSYEARMKFKGQVNQLTRAELAAETVRIDTLAESGDASARELIRKSAWEIAELACNVTPEMPEDGFDGILALGGFFRCGTFFRTECENALARIRKEYHFVYEPFKMIDAARDYALHLYRKETI